MKPVSFLQKVMVWFLIALLTALFFYVAVVKLASLTYAKQPDKGVVLIASMQDGDVNVYRLTWPGFSNCLVAVGELHGKTIAMVCNR